MSLEILGLCIRNFAGHSVSKQNFKILCPKYFFFSGDKLMMANILELCVIFKVPQHSVESQDCYFFFNVERKEVRLNVCTLATKFVVYATNLDFSATKLDFSCYKRYIFCYKT